MGGVRRVSIIVAFICCSFAFGLKSENERHYVDSKDNNRQDYACGEGLICSLSGAVFSVSGTGVMYNFTQSNSTPWYNDRNSIQSISIGPGVTSIGNWAFSECKSLTTVVFSNDLQHIGDCAFASCEKIESLNIPDSVNYIGNNTFRSCSKLKSVKISKNVKTIGESVFSRCSSLKNVTIPEGVTSIGDYAFFACFELETINIPDSVEYIGDSAFSLSKLKSVFIPANVGVMGTQVFSLCSSLKSIEVDEGNADFSSIDGLLFDHEQTFLIKYPEGNTNTSYIIRDGVSHIYSRGFEHSKLESVYIPASVRTIGKYAFSDCESLKNLTISNGVLSIGDYAFSGCSSLESVTIPASVTSIGVHSFSDCSKLKSIVVDEGNSNYSSIYGVVFNHESTVLLSYPAGKTDLGYIVPDGVSTIATGSFMGCNHLRTLVIPDSVNSIERGAFVSCNYLKTVIYQGSESGVSQNACDQCDLLKTICVSPNYHDITFCGKKVSSLSTCVKNQVMINQCFYASYENNRFIARRTNKSIEFESRPNGCAEYHCYNDTGFVSWSLCNNSDGADWICLNDTCTDNGSSVSGRIRIDFVLEDGVNTTELSAKDVLLALRDSAEIKTDNVSVGYEINKEGYIVRLIVYVDDEDIAKKVMDSMSSCVQTSASNS